MNCKCLKIVDEKLKPMGIKLDTAFVMSQETLSFEGVRVQIATTKLEGKRGKSKPITAAFCPFCGVAVKRDEDSKPWLVHVVGPDDLIEMPNELEALRTANATNIEIERERRPHANNPNHPFAIALAVHRDVNESE